MNLLPRNSSSSGVALVTTIIVVAVLAVVAVAFMQSASMDRLSSRTVRNYFDARLAAEAAASIAQGQVAQLIRRYPDSVTVWQNIGGEETNEATVLYVRASTADTNLGASPAAFGGEVVILAEPLVSGAQMVAPSAIGSAMPFDAATMINLNATNASQTDPWIGTRTTRMTNTNLPVREDGPPVTAAQWVYLGELPGPVGENNPPIARYAYWIEDESFKVNVNISSNGGRGPGSLGTNASELSVDGAFANSRSLNELDFDAMIDQRRLMPGSNFPTALTAAFPLDLPDTNAPEMRFLTTSLSAGLDLSRGGFRRFNINTVTNNIGSPTDTNDIRRNLDRVIAAITNTNSVPNFGQRFYRTSASAAGVNATNDVTTNHAGIYLQKIAANILDYVDSDDQPTIVDYSSDFSIRSGEPEYGIEAMGEGTDGTNSVAAMGVENLPRLQEYAIHGRLRKMQPYGYSTNDAPPDPSAEYEISIDHYFEFWNPGTRDIRLMNAFLKIYDQPRFGTKIDGPLAEEGRPTSKIPITNVVFPAGQVTVLTTAPKDEVNRQLIGGNLERVVSLEVESKDRLFSGTTRDVSTNSYAGFNRLFNVSLKPRQTTLTDYESAVLLGNTNGVLESFVGLPIVISGGSVPALHFVVSNPDVQNSIGNMAKGDSLFVRGGTLRGNRDSSGTLHTNRSGDPRSLNEQLEFKLYDNSGSGDQTRFFSTALANGSVPAESSVGAPNNPDFVRPTAWMDYSSTDAGAANAPLTVANSAFRSVGEFGHITDPARTPGSLGSLTNVVYSRGGGRTLRIGQPEHPRWFDGNQTNASRTWTSWRLADVFTTKTNLSLPGLVNPNGMLRDNGMAFRTMLNDFEFLPSPEGAPSTASEVLQLTNVNNLVTNALARMTNTNAWTPPGAVNPFWERGEISELSAFSSPSGPLGINMSNTFDRGREEIVRRSVEMITTRGSVFSAYVVAQALRVTPNATNVVSTARLKTTFEIIPQFGNGAGDDGFNPESASAIESRFSRPTNYTTKLLSSFYE